MSSFQEGFQNALGPYQMAKAGIDEGTARRKEAGLGGLMADYAAGGQPDYQGIAANGGNPLAVRQDADGQKERALQELGQMAGYLAALPDGNTRAQAFQSMRTKLDPLGQSLGLPPLPPQWDESHLPELQALAQQFGGAKQQSAGWQNLGNGYVMNAQGEVKQAYSAQDEEKSSYGYIPDPNNPENEVYAERRGRQFYALDGSPLYGGGNQPQRPPQGASGDVMATLQGMGAQFPGVQMTSGLRSPADNARVGGKPNSQHLRGTAADFVVPPQMRDQFTKSAQGQGFQVIDEGDHLHTQLPKGASRGAGPLPGSRPRYKAGAEGGQYATLNPQEIQSLGLPPGTVAQRSPSGQVQIVNKPRDIPGGQQQVIENADGTTTIIPAGKTTEDQNKSAGYAVRMEKALKDIERYTTTDPKKNPEGYATADPSANRPGVGTAMLDWLPDAVGNYGKSGARQNVEAAQLDALDAALTLNTGAAYTKEQLYSLRKSYFPQPGDDESVVAEKKSRLGNLIQTAKIRARGALPNPGQSGGKPGEAAGNAAPKRLKYNPATQRLE